MYRVIAICLLLFMPTGLFADYNECKERFAGLSVKKQQLEGWFKSSNYFYLRATMVAKNANDNYEVALNNGKRALLVTHDSTFNSPGRFVLLVRETEAKQVKTTNGWDQQWRVFEEASSEDNQEFESNAKKLRATEAEMEEVKKLAASVRFARDAAGVVTDFETCLQWIEGPDSDMTWHQANKWIVGLGGKWREPTLDEAKSICVPKIQDASSFAKASVFRVSGDIYCGVSNGKATTYNPDTTITHVDMPLEYSSNARAYAVRPLESSN